MPLVSFFLIYIVNTATGFPGPMAGYYNTSSKTILCESERTQCRRNSLSVWLNSGRVCGGESQLCAALFYPSSLSQTGMANGARYSLQLSPQVSSEVLSEFPGSPDQSLAVGMQDKTDTSSLL